MTKEKIYAQMSFVACAVFTNQRNECIRCRVPLQIKPHVVVVTFFGVLNDISYGNQVYLY